MSYKERHEQFVSDLTGGPLWEIYAVAVICFMAQALWSCSGRAGGAVPDFVLNWLVPLASITLYANRPWWLALSLAIPLALVYGSRKTPAKAAKAPKNAKAKAKASENDLPLAHRPFVTMYRATMLVMTAAAILAVDFRVFPRRFAKVETWGTSLMDLGVGSFVFSMGIVSSRRSLRYRNGTQPLFLPELKQSLRHSFTLLALGAIRLISVKWLGYQEHVSEYGVHWNFFITLGLLPPLFVLLERFAVPFIPQSAVTLKGYLVALAYELTLKNTGLQEWILTAPRDNVLAANKEGVFSFWGYLAIFMVGYGTGKRILSNDVPISQVVKRLLISSAIGHVVFGVLRVATEPSRRLANLPYIMLVVSYNAAILAVCAVIEQWSGSEQVPKSLERVNKHGQKFFLAANVFTGVVNMGVNTIDLSRLPALAVLSAYMAALFLLVQTVLT